MPPSTVSANLPLTSSQEVPSAALPSQTNIATLRRPTGGVIAGAVVGGLLFIVILAVLVFRLVLRRRQRKKVPSAESVTHTTTPYPMRPPQEPTAGPRLSQVPPSVLITPLPDRRSSGPGIPATMPPISAPSCGNTPKRELHQSRREVLVQSAVASGLYRMTSQGNLVFQAVRKHLIREPANPTTDHSSPHAATALVAPAQSQMHPGAISSQNAPDNALATTHSPLRLLTSSNNPEPTDLTTENRIQSLQASIDAMLRSIAVQDMARGDVHTAQDGALGTDFDLQDNLRAMRGQLEILQGQLVLNGEEVETELLPAYESPVEERVAALPQPTRDFKS